MGLLQKLGLPPVPVAKPPKPGTGGAGPVIGAARVDPKEKAYRDAFAEIQADHAKAAETVARFGVALTDDLKKRWGDAEKARTENEAKKDWTAALGAVSVLKIVARQVVGVRAAYDTYQVDLSGLRVELEASKPYRANEMLARFRVAFDDAWAALQKVARQKDWAKASALVPPALAAARTLIAQGQSWDAGRQPFEAEFAKLKNIEAALAIAAAPTKGIANSVQSFRNRYTVVNDARNGGRFDEATKGLPLLQAAASQLLIDKAADDQKRLAFQAEYAGLPKPALLASLAAAAPPELAKEAAAYRNADKVVADARAAADWAAGLAALPALKKAAEALEAAKTVFNGKLDPKAREAFNQKVAALKPRSDKALDSPVPAFVVPLQKAVLVRVVGIQDLVAAEDFAGAELGHAKLLAELAAMEKAKKDHADFLGRLKTAKDGEIAKALAVDLKVPGLIAARKKAMEKAEASIKAAADKGNIALADRKLKDWVVASKAWADAKDAYDSLHAGGTPDEAKLKSLAGKPGGGEVLDDLVADLPDGAQTKVVSVAMKARFGIAVKRFDAPKADAADTKGLVELNKNLPDKSLKKAYEVLAKVPGGRLKGKVTDLIQYDADAGGAMYDLNKKIYMYCGRVDDPDASKQKFNVDGEVVPKGEKVDEACKPVDDKELPYFDFALLHEAGHAEDDAINFMENRLNNASFGGWQIHNAPDAVADAAAKHFAFDRAYILATLKAKGSSPPKAVPKPASGVDAAEWEERRKKAVVWCESVREGIGLWWKAGLSKQVAIGGRVYQEAYENYWVSYLWSARAQGLTGYQFRSHMEWFAELYAGFFSKKLKPNHPAAGWLQQFKPPKG